MSIRNEDRHGLKNLKHEEVKVLDRIQVPPLLVLLLIAGPVFYVLQQITRVNDEKAEKLHQDNLQAAKRKTQERMVYESDEVTAAEELIESSTQFSAGVEKRAKAEKRKLDMIKKAYLTDGLATKAAEKVDIKTLLS